MEVEWRRLKPCCEGEVGREAVREGGSEGGEEEALEDFREGAEEGDGTVGGGEVGGFVGLQDREDVGCLPDGGDMGVGNGEVEGGGDEGEGSGTKVFKVSVRHSVRANCGRVPQ